MGHPRTLRLQTWASFLSPLHNPLVSLQGLMLGVDGMSFFRGCSFPLPVDLGLELHLLFLAL